ncbi:MAG: exodeoxyribonuclease VII large subunit, partial [Omnitrophica WOR_2 bacterium RIFCSPHIGHO2_01_FULL_52_10]
MNNSEYLTVSDLNRFIKDVLNAGFPRPVWVCGEIQQYDRNKGKKHIFFELVEKDSRSDEILARVGLVIFANRKTAIDQILVQSENAFALKDDIEVKFRCTVDFYPPHGAVRLIVEEIDPTYTLGKLAQEKQKLIAALKEKGVLDKNKQLPLPPVPLTIGLITSDDSAAYNDFISELRKSGYGFKVYLRNTLMQGKNAPKDVCRAFAELQRLDGLEAIIITRGGGSLAELSCFDSALIAEA